MEKNENRTIDSLFAVPLFSKDFKYEEKQRFINHAKNYPSVEVSNVGGFQSDFLNPAEDVVSDFLDAVLQDVQAAVGFFGLREADSLAVSGVWMNVNDRDHWNHIHNHPGADFAVVVYFKVPENSGDIVFYNNDPVKQASEFYTTPLGNDTEFSRLKYAHTPREDSIVIFPAHLMHNVMVNESEEERISVALNISVKRSGQRFVTNNDWKS